jgi:hypothetical protein
VTAKISVPVRTLIWLACAIAGASLASLLLQQDANWDLQNYHFYNPHAFINDRLDWDIAPAQLQTFHNPLLDLPFYWAVRADLKPQWIAVLLALPVGIAGFFLFLIVSRLFRGWTVPHWRMYAGLALVLGLTGSAGVPLIGSTMNDWSGAMLIMVAIWLLLIAHRIEGDRKWVAISFAGLCAGFATGLKLTSAYCVLALCIALLATVRPFSYRAVPHALAFTGMAALGFVTTAGFWLWKMYVRFGNPLFPYFNDWFQSPWWELAPLRSPHIPQSLFDALVLPFRLFRHNQGVVGEIAFRDWRVPLVLIVALAAFTVRRTQIRLVAFKPPTINWEWRFVITFWFIAFIVWMGEHAIYRYIIPLELLSGAMIVFLLCITLPSRAQLPAAIVVAGVVVASTTYPNWWRVPFREHFFEIAAPKLPDNAMVLIVHDTPIAYVIPFFDPKIRWIGVMTNINKPWHNNLLAQQTRNVITSHTGPFYSMQSWAGVGDDILAVYGLEKQRDTCTPIRTNMPHVPIVLCELRSSSNK